MFSINFESKFSKGMAARCVHIISVLSEWNFYAQSTLCQRSLRLELKFSNAKLI